MTGKFYWAILVLLAFISLARAETKSVYRWDPASFKSTSNIKLDWIERDGTKLPRITTTGGEWNSYFIVPAGVLKGGKTYTAVVEYEVLTPVPFPGTFHMFARSKSLGEDRDIWQRWLGEPKKKGTARLTMTLKPADDWVFHVGCRGIGSQIIRSMAIYEGDGLIAAPVAQNASPPSTPPATGASAIQIDPPGNPAGSVLNAADFGLHPDASGQANFASIKKALDTARTQKARKLVIPAGVYRFHSDEAIPLTSFTDFELDGQGSEFIFQKLHPNVPAINVSNCVRTVLKDLKLDWDWSVTPLASLCEVTTLADDKLSCELTFPDLNEQQIELVKKAPWRQVFPMDAKTLVVRQAKRMSSDVDRFESAGGNKLRVFFKKPVDLNIGESYCIRHQYYDMSAFRIGESSHLLFDNVTIYSMPGMGFVSRGNMNNWGFRGCKIIRREGSRHPLTCSADGFHVTESRGNLLVEDCEFTGLGDDCINIHDNVAQGVQRVDDRTLKLLGNHRWHLRIEEGHTIELSHSDYSPIPYTSKVSAVKYEKNDTILTLESKLPEVVAQSTIVSSQHFGSSNVRVVNSKFHDTSGRGVLTSARNLTIENCMFDRVWGQAVQLAIDISPPHWAEGKPVSNVVIRGNKITRVNGAGRNDGAAICTFTRWPAGGTDSPLYRNLLIENNEFIDPIGPAMSLRNVENAIVQKNRVTSNGLPATGDRPASFLLHNSSKITLRENQWSSKEQSIQLGVFVDPATTADVLTVR